MRALKLLACCAAVLLLGACSAVRLAYDHLDTVIRWEVSEYVDLTAPQRRAFNAELDPLWRWHRQSQLPLYAADLRELADQVQAGPLSLQQVEAANARILAYWDAFADQAAPGYSRVVGGFSDAQVADMIRRIGKELERKSRKERKLSAEQHRQHLIDAMNDGLRDWIGRPDPAQAQLLEQWATEAAAAVPQQDRENERQARLGRYTALLASRTQPGFEDRVRAYFRTPDHQQRTPEQQDLDRRLQLLATLSASLQPAQRQHLCRKLLDYAADFDALAAEAPQQRADAAGG
jgi:hypothetical protein